MSSFVLPRCRPLLGLFVAAAAGLVLATAHGTKTQAQGFPYPPPPMPMCAGPYGPQPCGPPPGFMIGPGPGSPIPMGNPFGGPAPAMGGPFPGAGALPQDAVLTATIAQQCGGQPQCMAGAWGSIEIQRCRGGIGVPGGCFGPNGELMRLVDRNLPHNFHPDVVLHNLDSDLRNGPGRNNDLVGKDGWVCKTLFGGC